MQTPFLAGGEALEAAGAGILQRIAVSDVGRQLEHAGSQLAILAALMPQLLPDDGNAASALSGQRLAYAAENMMRAGQELQGVQPPAPKGKSWLKGGI